MSVADNDDLTNQYDQEIHLNRIIMTANYAVLQEDFYTTPVAIRFRMESSGSAINVASKYTKLYVEMRKIDETIIFLDLEGEKYKDPPLRYPKATCTVNPSQ